MHVDWNAEHSPDLDSRAAHVGPFGQYNRIGWISGVRPPRALSVTRPQLSRSCGARLNYDSSGAGERSTAPFLGDLPRGALVGIGRTRSNGADLDEMSL